MLFRLQGVSLAGLIVSIRCKKTIMFGIAILFQALVQLPIDQVFGMIFTESPFYKEWLFVSSHHHLISQALCSGSKDGSKDPELEFL